MGILHPGLLMSASWSEDMTSPQMRYSRNCVKLTYCVFIPYIVLQVVVVQNPKYFKKLAPIIQATDSRTISNYLLWRAVKSSMNDLNKEAGEVRADFKKATTGANSDPPRWKKCVKEAGFNSYTDSSTRVAASSMYIKGRFTT